MKLIPIVREIDIPREFFDTPIGDFFRYNNLRHDYKKYDNAQLLIGMCMDYRKHLRIPDNFAYIIRTGGANLRYSEFKVSYSIAIGKVRHIILLGHNNCGMVNLISKKDTFVQGLVDISGWERRKAEEHFMNYAPMFEIDNEIDFVVHEAKRLKEKYRISVAPLYYRVEDNQVFLIDHEGE